MAALVVAAVASPAAALPDEWSARWRSDLRFLADTLPRIHPNPYHAIAREELNRELDSLAARAPALDHEAMTVDLARILARIGDGHTRLTLPVDSAAAFFSGHSITAPPKIPGLVFRHLPIRLRFFRDGLYVIRADRAHRALLGGRVVELGSLPIEAAIRRVEPVSQRDNDRHLLDLLPGWLVVPEILHARGVVSQPGAVRIVVETRGRRHESRLAPVPPGTSVTWIDARGQGDPPLAERRPGERHWFQPLPGADAVYARYREVMDDGPRTVEAFSDSLFAALSAAPQAALVLDLRGNVGGNGFLNQPILRGILRSPALERPARLFVLADRGTFSAAVMLLAQLEQQTPAVIVGEKSGGNPNSYGDSRRVRLPETGLTARIATLYWQSSDPRDPRDGVTPILAAEPSFDEWRQRRDPALEKVIARLGPPGDPAGTWRGEIGLAYQRVPITLRVARLGAGYTVRADAPELQLRDAPLADVSFTAGELSFALLDSGPAWRFAGRVTAGAITGVARFQGARLPLVLTRVED